MSFTKDAVPESVVGLFNTLKPFAEKMSGIYLAGGTALSFYLGHRVSVDLDFFIPSDFRALDVTEDLQSLGTFKPLDVKDNSVVCQVDDVQFSLFRYQYPLLAPLDHYSDIPLASIRDIAAMKISAIGDRGVRKDFYDLYAILKRTPLTIDQILGDVRAKFNLSEDALYHYIRALGFFEDSRKEPDLGPLVKMEVQWKEIELFFMDLAKGLISNLTI